MKKEVEMNISWRTVQMFISDEGVAEVEIDADLKDKIRCSCKAYSVSSKCRHIKFVKNRMEEGEGHYVVQVPEDVDDDEAIDAMKDPSKWRAFVIKHGEVEVL
jgi:hypothetical protein